MKKLLILFVLLSINTAWSQHDNPGTGELCESSEPNQAIDMQCLEEQLKTTGLGGWVHASVQDQVTLVFTWRRPGDFFTNIQLPMLSEDREIMQQLLQLQRHDQIEIKGEFFENEAPIEHINVTELTVIKAYEGPSEEYEYDPNLMTSILNNDRLIGKVHIVANGGSVLVVELGDRVLPVFNSRPELTNGLYRNDKIELHYQVQYLPMRPNHLIVNPDMDQPVRVIERMVEGHGEPIELTGPLVMFPESPQIRFNIFALRTEDQDLVNRNFTIVNFQDFDLFMAIRQKLQDAWDANILSATYDRNKFINRNIQVTVRGEKNVVSPDQANPQVLPAKIEDVEITIR
jgi:hypothetical protein